MQEVVVLAAATLPSNFDVNHQAALTSLSAVRSGRDCIQNNTQKTWLHNGTMAKSLRQLLFEPQFESGISDILSTENNSWLAQSWECPLKRRGGCSYGH